MVIRRATLWIAAWALGGWLGSAGAWTAYGEVSSDAAPRAEPVYAVQVGDVLQVDVIGYPELHQEVEISTDGEITFPLLGDLPVTGLTLIEIDALLTAALAKDYLVNPLVTVKHQKKLGGAAETSGTFFVFGEVKSPGAYPVRGKMDILMAITLAGGLTDFSGKKVKVIHKGTQGEEVAEVDIAAILSGQTPSGQVLVRDKDVVIVPRSYF